MAMIASALAGCGGNPRYPVNPNVAQETLKTTLDGWKSGKTPSDLKTADPAIVVQDADWSGGAKLMSYEVQPDATPVDANLVAKVKLTLESADGKKKEKMATYLVGTEPVLTVFRDMFR
jgi:hypothetical protein